MLPETSLTSGQGVDQGIPAFDQRPGDLEATRGLGAVPVVYGRRHDGEGWRVVISREGWQLLELTPAQALTMAADLAAYARICDQGNAQ